ncbi:MAG: NnrS family protein [Gammaproteobacteria bacterium]|nr:NnrS family protein [Gammaproteobacteria bacterium]
MSLSKHPVWLVGFRPFFILSCLSGLTLPIIWTLLFAGTIGMPDSRYSIVQWHAHEMFFGFGWALLGGFLLTATKNWVKIRGYHGSALVFLVAAWCFERLGMAFGASWPQPLFLLSNQLFLVSLIGMLLWSLLKYREADGYRRDNLFFLIVLPLFIPAKVLLLSAGHGAAGTLMVLGLFRVCFLIMLERTLSEFMRGIFKTEILRNPLLDGSIKVLGLAMVFAGFLPPLLGAGIAVTLALLLTVRFFFWKPLLACSRLDLGIMYLGYLAIAAQLLVAAYEMAGRGAWVGTFSIHLFTFGVMGLIIPAMIIRISRGHTGRKVMFDAIDKTVLWLMILALALRVIAPQLAPGSYRLWIELAASCWFIGFGILAWRSTPMLLRPRIDGREH